MKVLIVASGAVKRREVREAVLEALQGEGECRSVSHEKGKEICSLWKPDLVVVCDYERVMSPVVNGFQAYDSIKLVMPEESMIRVGDRPYKYENYCQSLLSLQAAVYMHHRKRGGAIFSAGRAAQH